MQSIMLFHLVIIYTQAHDHARKGFIITTKNGKRYLAKGPTKPGAKESESPHDYADYLRQKRLKNFQMRILKRNREQGLPGKNLATLPERRGFVYDIILSHEILRNMSFQKQRKNCILFRFEEKLPKKWSQMQNLKSTKFTPLIKVDILIYKAFLN